MIDMKVEGWNRSRLPILGDHQGVYAANPNKSLEDLASNGRGNILVVSAHQDDEIIGAGGTIARLSEGVGYWDGRGSREDWIDSQEGVFSLGGLEWYSVKTVRGIQKRLINGGIDLKLLPEQPKNVVVAYVTNGAKDEETLANDFKLCSPDSSLEQFLHSLLGRTGVVNLSELNHIINKRRYPETLEALGYVGASAAVFLENPSSQIRPEKPGNIQAVNDLAELIDKLKPEIILTLSPFEFSHNSHIYVSDITVSAARMVQTGTYHPELYGFPVWDPNHNLHRTIVDISKAVERKSDAIHVHSIFGSQGIAGRGYESVKGLNFLFAMECAAQLVLMYGPYVMDYTNEFDAHMQRPRNPKYVRAIETFFDMTSLLKDQSLTFYGFAESHYHKPFENYPVRPLN